MTEALTPAAASAIQSRLTRARAALAQGQGRTEVWEASLVAAATYELARALRVRGCVSRHAYASARAALADASENLAALMGADIAGTAAESVPDLFLAARCVETACRALARQAPSAP